jgi:hypothetical protein
MGRRQRVFAFDSNIFSHIKILAIPIQFVNRIEIDAWWNRSRAPHCRCAFSPANYGES